MAKPVSNFYFKVIEKLKLKFQDLSNDSIQPPVTSWAWNFGNGNTSTAQNPEHTYNAPGIYLVSLTVTNAEGVSIRSVYITLDAEKWIITIPIIEIIRTKIPSQVFDFLTATHLIQKWQQYLQPQINPEPIPEDDVYNEAKWPTIANSLIADLCVFDILMGELDKLVGASGQSVLTGTSGTTNVNNPNGNVKVVELGPSKTEWYNQQESGAMYFKAVLANSSSFVPEFKSRLCTLAMRLSVTLPFCDEKKINFLFVKAGRLKEPTFNIVEYYPSLKAYEQPS
jgi:PKD repeat protein